jgi:transposase, IS5 family
MPSLGKQLDPRQPLKRLADTLAWLEFEQAFGQYYSAEGRPAKPVRLMVGLLLLKQLFNQGNETVVVDWIQNPYWQYFCGMTAFQWTEPGDPSDLVCFRQRIGEVGMQHIPKVSVRLHEAKAQEKEVVVDTTVQEKTSRTRRIRNWQFERHHDVFQGGQRGKIWKVWKTNPMSYPASFL